MGFIEGTDRVPASLLPACIDDSVAFGGLVRIVDAFVDSLDLVNLGFTRAIAAATGRPDKPSSARAPLLSNSVARAD
jgi:transposase